MKAGQHAERRKSMRSVKNAGVQKDFSILLTV